MMGIYNMASEINITVNNPSLPPGVVRIQDTANLCHGLYEVVAKLIQLELGYSVKKRLKDEPKRLASIVLNRIREGSGVLCHEALPIDDITGTLPAIYATTVMIKAVKQYNEIGTWPTTFPVGLRNKWGQSLETAVYDDATVGLSVKDNGITISCDFGYAIKEALKKPEEFSTDLSVDCVGDLLGISMKNNTFNVYTDKKAVTVILNDEQESIVDNLRWKRVFIRGYPLDSRCNKIGELLEIREATEDEDYQIPSVMDDQGPESIESYQYVKQRVSEFGEYDVQWDSYNAKAPSKQVLKFGLTFYKEVCSFLMHHEIEIPSVFLVPTPSGGIQFEWIVSNRELEIEIPTIETFEFLAVKDDDVSEGEASRWDALRLVHWVITGDEI
jgi:hypothetical protein